MADASFGTGSSTIGDTGAITAALERRRFGDSVSPLSQVSPSLPGGQAPTPQPVQGQGSATPQGAGQIPPSALPQTNAEAQMIIQTLSKRLGKLSP